MAQYLVSTDTGGTFVDVVVSDSKSGRYYYSKAPSNPKNPPEGIMAGIAAAAEQMGQTLQTILSESKMLFNGTTVTTNAMIERKGAKTGLLITKGFEDTLAIARVLGRTAGLDELQLADYRHADPPAPIVARELIRGITERVDAFGDVLVPMNMQEAEQAADELVEQGAEAIAICLLWSFRNPVHEKALQQLIKTKYPQLFIVSSNELVPIIREFERANTTAINAFLGPVFQRYADGLQERLKQENHLKEPLIMQSIGGLAPANEIHEIPITTLLSGPVGGVIASQKLGRLVGEENLITTDMGGTSFDVGLIISGQPVTTPITVIERQPVAIPTVDVVTVGAGGGSAAWLNEVGSLQVGPESMGAVPGPACYGRGGAIPTVTDADVMLGYIDADHFLGGRMTISKPLAEQAIGEKIAKPMGMSTAEAAAAIYQIVNARMADFIRMATVERGHDPRDFAMLAFGGCGPTHCTGYGPEIGVRRLIVPYSATVFSAFGIGQSDIRHTFVHSYTRILRDKDGAVPIDSLADFESILTDMTVKAKEQLQRDNVPETSAAFQYSADMRYKNQIHELVVPIRHTGASGEPEFRQLIADFQKHYELKYGHGASSSTTMIEMLNLRLDIIASTGVEMPQTKYDVAGSDPGGAFIESKPIYQLHSGRYEKAPVYQAEKLQPGNRIEGPALIVSYGTTIPLHANQRLEVDPYQNYVITFQ